MPVEHATLRVASSILPETVRKSLLHRVTRQLRAQLRDCVTDNFLEVLLYAMELAFAVSGRYRSNILKFDATCVIRTLHDEVAATAVFRRGHMKVEHRARPAYDVCVTFKDAHAVWAFLLSEDQDIVDSVLANTVEVDGNLNYLYWFGFLAKDLARTLGVA